MDDEGIPLVYAQNLLRGRGLIYDALEGRVEGYSDFLHVLVDAGRQALVRAIGWPKLSVFFLGKAVALAAGAGTLALAFLTMRRLASVGAAGAVTGLVFLTTAGPFALWSCSSLETAPFAFLLMGLTYAMVAATQTSDTRRYDRMALVAAILVVLERLDGVVFAFAVVGSFLLYSTRERRRALLRRIVLPLVVALVAYHAWRIWYFGDLFNTPMYAKVLYKLRPHGQVLVKAPARAYLLRFVDIYGWMPLALAALTACYAVWRTRAVRPMLIAVMSLSAYVSTVGDWMFGFRFFVPLLPLAAVSIAEAATAVFSRRVSATWAVALAVTVWCGVSAAAFERQYESVERKPSWLHEPSLSPSRHFGSYYTLFEVARSQIGEGPARSRRVRATRTGRRDRGDIRSALPAALLRRQLTPARCPGGRRRRPSQSAEFGRTSPAIVALPACHNNVRVAAHPLQSNPALRVVLFSGGRGAGVLATQLVRDPRVHLTLAINGYDDGASTGEVRRWLGDSLGPSDFRKNASRLADELGSCPPALIALLDSRLPEQAGRDEAIAALGRVSAEAPALAARVDRVTGELASGTPFDFSDCSVGNLVFAGSFLLSARDFNAAVDDYCSALGLAPGVVENVTDGTNAFLVALEADGAILGSEEEIVDATRRNRISDIFLIDRPLTAGDRERLAGLPRSEVATFFGSRRATLRLNPRLANSIAAADLIIYAPGTQHSSLFPSYLTPGLGGAIAANLRAIKLLITNIQTDAEIAGSSAVDIIERALYYLREKGAVHTPTPCLITHYVVNDPGQTEAERPYVPLGQIDTLEDPRLVRIANYEDGVSGRHDAGKILGPFIQSFVERRGSQKVAVLLHDAGSVNKVTQTILETVRGGIAELPVDVTMFYEGEPLDASFVASLPLGVRALDATRGGEGSFRQAVQNGGFDYVILFESSGMYRGEDIAALASHLAFGRLDAVWGSRRLSVRDIQESYRLRYRHNVLLGSVSYVGSHVLSLACLTLYGRYISDTLSAVRAIRTGDALAIRVPLTHKFANQHLLAQLLRRKAEILEIPVQFLPISPERVKRTSIVEGLQSLGALVGGRFRALRPDHPAINAELAEHAERKTSSANSAVSALNVVHEAGRPVAETGTERRGPAIS